MYYPHVPGVRGKEAHRALRVVNATDPVKRFAASSRDSGTVLAQLLGDLGSARSGFLGAAASALLLGGALGAEVAHVFPRVREMLGDDGGDRGAQHAVEAGDGRRDRVQEGHTQRRRIEAQPHARAVTGGAGASGEARQRPRQPELANAG